MRNHDLIGSDSIADAPDMPDTSGPIAATQQFLLKGPMGSWCATGVHRVLFRDSIDVLVSRCAETLCAIDKSKDATPFLVGALPFERSASCWLYQPKTRSSIEAEALTDLCRPVVSNIESADVSPSFYILPNRELYQEMVKKATIRLRQNSGCTGALRKVVLARSLTVDRGTEFDMGRLLQRLMEDSSVTTYGLPLPNRMTEYAPRYLVGATPELLISRRGSRIESHPLAGSIPRHFQPEMDRNAADYLMRSEKDLAEHQVVVEFIADLLAPLCSDFCVPVSPSLRATRSMWHLGTHITGKLKHPDDMNTSSCLALAARLQPTPALCGAPRDHALDLIRQLEPFERGFYGGAVGWSDIAGNGDWHVAIRCAEVQGGRAQLYAGAGIMHDSNPHSEADETAAKFNAMIYALELEDAIENCPLTAL